jgi:hypothetical protein
MTSIACLRTAAREWVNRESKSGATSRANVGVRRRDTADNVELRWATVSEEGEDEKIGVGGWVKS